MATSGDGLAGVGGIPYHAPPDVARRLRAGLEGTAALDDDDEDTDGKSSHDEDERLERVDRRADVVDVFRTACRSAT